jgi:hypothetical protein
VIAVGTFLATLPHVSLAGSNQPQAGQNPIDPTAGDRLPLRSADPATAGPRAWLGAGGPGSLAAVVGADFVVVALYVTVGRLSHDEGLSAGGLLHTGWPFLVGLAGGYVGVLLSRWPALALRAGAVVSVKTVIIGLVLRYGVARDGTPLPYVIVTAVVLIGLTLAWRAVVLRTRRP